MPLWLLPLLIGEVVDLGLSRWLFLAGRRERLAVQGDGREGRDAIVGLKRVQDAATFAATFFCQEGLSHRHCPSALIITRRYLNETERRRDK